MNAYIRRPGTLAQDLINTCDVTRPEPEYLRTPGDLGHYLHAWEIWMVQEPDDRDLAEVLALRDRLRTVFETKDAQVVAATLNELLAGACLTPGVVLQQDGRVELELQVPHGEPLVRRLAFQAAMELSMTIQQYGLERLHVCHAAPCREVFVDRSRNHTRRYCSDQCANRHNVSAYRRRRQASTS